MRGGCATTDAQQRIGREAPRGANASALQRSADPRPDTSIFVNVFLSSGAGVPGLQARAALLIMLTPLTHVMRTLACGPHRAQLKTASFHVLFYSLGASRIPSQRDNPHADTRSGIDASWLVCRRADYAPRLRPSPGMAQELLVSSSFCSFLLFILLLRLLHCAANPRLEVTC